MPDLKQKVALIVGASSGIGAATAIHFAQLGAKLSLVGRNEANLQRVADDCRRYIDQAEYINLIIADVTDEADARKVIDSTVKKFGQLDVLVNSAGILEMGSIETSSLEQYDKVMDINARATYHLMMLAVPHLIVTRGNIVNVSSVNGTRSFSNVFAYCVSKSAVDQMTRCAALELASKGVRVNSVNPGVVITEVHKRAGLSDDQYGKFLEHSKTTHPLGRAGQPEEVAHAIAFLASSDASFITAEHLHVDGGRHAACPR